MWHYARAKLVTHWKQARCIFLLSKIRLRVQINRNSIRYTLADITRREAVYRDMTNRHLSENAEREIPR